MFRSLRLSIVLGVAFGPPLLACSEAPADDDSGTQTSDSGTTGTDGGDGSDGIAAGVCDPATRVGSFELTLEDEYSGLQGRVESGVTPFRVADVVAAEGSCTFYRPPGLFCDPLCLLGETCNGEGECIEAPVAISAGIVSVDGLADMVEMQSSAPAYFYTYLGTLDHPPAAEGAALTLHASGADGLAGFSLDAYAITALEVAGDSVALAMDVPMTVTWEASGQATTSINALLNIAQHGGTAGWIECEFPDTGALELPVGLTNQLLTQGFSGFPTLVLTRQSGDAIETEFGCVQWVTESSYTLNVAIDGLTSCSSDDDCTAPEICQATLICG